LFLTPNNHQAYSRSNIFIT